MDHSFRKNQEGQIILIGIVFFAILLMLSAALLGYITSYVKSEKQTVARTQALLLAEAGIDQAASELNRNAAYTGETDTPLGNGTFTVALSAIDSKTRRVTSTGRVTYGNGQTATRVIKAIIAINSSAVSFHYGIQAGDGGFTLNNSSSIIGNVFSTGPIIGSGANTSCGGSPSGSGNCILGDVVSAGPGGLVYGIHATGTVFSNSLGHSSVGTTIEKDAYYSTARINTVVRGNSFPASIDQSPVPLPISDAQISEWEAIAEAGTVISSCDASNNYVITSSVTLGPAKIMCNLVVKSSSAVLTVAGPIWVLGNITTQTGPTIRMDPSLGAQNVAIIADNPYDRMNSGIITVGQSSQFAGSGAPGSFVFLISQNNSAENGGSTSALALSQGASAMVAYAAHGLAALGQSVNVKEVTAYKITLSQSASVTYDTGLPSTLFATGPGGSWSYTQGSYVIQQ